MAADPTIYVVHVDHNIRGSVRALAHSMQLRCQSFARGEDFLETYDDQSPGALVSGLVMPGMTGLDLLGRLNAMEVTLPVVILTAHATTSLTVRAIRQGAVTVLDEPCADCVLWTAICNCLELNAHRRPVLERHNMVRKRIASLSNPERLVMEMVASGKPNKVIAGELDVSIRTIENRRRDIYSKLNVNSAVDLVRMVIQAEADDRALNARRHCAE